MRDDENTVLTPTSDNTAAAAHAAPVSTTITPVASRKSSRVLYFIGRLAALVVVYLFFAILTPGTKGFTSDANTQLMLQDIAVVAMAAIGMTIVIIAGGIDLSAGSVIALSMITSAYVLNLGTENNKLVAQHPY